MSPGSGPGFGWIVSHRGSIRVLGTGDVVPLPPGVPLVFLCVGLSVSVYL